MDESATTTNVITTRLIILIVISNVEILLLLLRIEVRHALFAVDVWYVNYATSRRLIIIIILFSGEYQKIYSTHTYGYHVLILTINIGFILCFLP